jgi:hypothetical protein
MIPSRAALRLSALCLALASSTTGCQSNEGRGIEIDSIMEGIAGFLGNEHPVRRLQQYSGLHDAATFRHGPDTPDTWNQCREDLQWFAECDYETWKDVSLATYFVTRAVVDDASALSRGEAIRTLRRLGGMLLEAEVRTGELVSEDDAYLALRRMNEIHGAGGVHVPDEAATAVACDALVARLGGLRVDDDLTASPEALRTRMKVLRGILNHIIAGGYADEVRSPEGQRALDGALISIGAQTVRLSLLMALRGDPRAEVRTDAAATLGVLEAVTSAPGLARAYGGEESNACRREIVIALGCLATSAAAVDATRDVVVPVLIDALDDDDGAVAFNARTPLVAMAGKDLGSDPSAWRKWWTDSRLKSR